MFGFLSSMAEACAPCSTAGARWLRDGGARVRSRYLLAAVCLSVLPGDDAAAPSHGVSAHQNQKPAQSRWEPDPIEADPDRSARSRRTDDIISILINVYGAQVGGRVEERK